MPDQGDCADGWLKSSRSGGTENCVEVRFGAGFVEVRHSKAPDGPIIVFSEAEWKAFVDGVADGELRR